MDDKIVEELIPIPTLEEQRQKIIKDLEEEGFPIRNYSSGSVFWTIIMIFCQIRIDILNMLRAIYKSLFIVSALKTWLDVKASDYSKKRKQATKTIGKLTITKTNIDDEVVIPSGYIFKTLTSLAGNEYRFLSTEKTIIPKGELVGYITVQAEKEGSVYNVPTHSIKKSIVHIQGLEDVTNADGWLVNEGADTENDDQLKERTLNSWAELSTMPIALKYKNVAESVEGVLYVLVDDMHPRGQGTVDIIVASYAGTAGNELLAKVEEACNKIKGVYDDLLFKSAETITVDISMILYLPYSLYDENIEQEAIGYVREYFKISKSRDLNTLYISELTYFIRKDMSYLKGIKVITPNEDLYFSRDKVIILGEVSAIIERV